MSNFRKRTTITMKFVSAALMLSLAGCAASTPTPESAGYEANRIELQHQQMRNARCRLVQMSLDRQADLQP